MYSNIVPFENIIDAVFDETHIANLRNLYPTIRRLIYRIERDIGFGYGLLIKKIPYSIESGTILENRLKLPEDLIYIEALGTCENGLCPGMYIHQGTYLFLCAEANIESFDLVYYTMLQDGEGNPAITENHFDCIVAGIIYYLAKPKKWNREMGLQDLSYYEKYYFDRIGEAIGNDVMPTTEEEWSQIAGHLKMSYRDMLIYDNKSKCYKCVPSVTNTEVVLPGPDDSDDIVYHWQYDNLESDINDTILIDQAFLDLQSKEAISIFLKGITISYTNIGRIALAIANIEIDTYQIRDAFETDITSLVFDTYYNNVLRIQYYVSKDIYSYGSIYYKFVKN